MAKLSLMDKLRAGEIHERLVTLSSGYQSSFLVSKYLTYKNIQNYHINFPPCKGLTWFSRRTSRDDKERQNHKFVEEPTPKHV